MLATGVRTEVGVKVFGDDLDMIQEVVPNRWPRCSAGFRGAVDVVPDQICRQGLCGNAASTASARRATA